ncbi:MAG: GLUG motif-containing protein [Candidatus Saliniplasma sp.]
MQKCLKVLGVCIVAFLVVSTFSMYFVNSDIYNELEEDNDDIEESELQAVQEIYDWNDLWDVRGDDGENVLMNELNETTAGYDDLVDTENGWEPIGDQYYPFLGTFNGNGHEISDLYINRSDTDYVALFGHTDEGAEITNVGVVDAEVRGREEVGGLVGENKDSRVNNSYTTGNVSGENQVGGLVGYNDGPINNSYSTSNVHLTDYGGGLVGYNDGNSISNSYASGNVNGNECIGGLVGQHWYSTVSNSYATGDVTGSQGVGGLMGYNWDGTVSNSYAAGTVIDGDYIGGLLGYNRQGLVDKSYATGAVTGGNSVGGLLGYNSGTVSNSFWDVDTTGQTTSDGGTGKNTAEMKDVATFTDLSTVGLEEPWDFVGNPYDDEQNEYIWNVDDDEVVNDGYPFLRWEDVGFEIYSLVANSTKGGQVTEPVEGEFLCEPGEVIDLEAVPDEGSAFVEWTGDNTTIEDTKSNLTTINMDGDKEITAVFEGVATFDIFLSAGGEADGWNFVSFNIDLEDNDLESILEHEEHGITGNYSRLMYYDASVDEWTSYEPGRTDHFNKLDTWDHAMGLWIRMAADDTLTVKGYKPTDTTITLHEGWNMVSYPSSEPGTGVPDQVSQIGYFDALAENNLAYTTGVDTFEFEPGEGYWIYAEQEVEWTVEY